MECFMTFEIWLTLFLASIAISVSPGAGAVLSMNYGINYGLKKSYWAILGLQTGYLIQMIIVIIGLGSLIAKSIFLFNIIKWIGVAYLLYLGLSAFFKKAEIISDEEKINSYNPKKAFINATLINLTNIKATVFLVAFIPQFLNPNESIWFQFLVISLTLCIVDILVMTGYSSMASRLKFLLKDIKAINIQNKVTGIFLIIAALFMSTAKKS